MNSDVANDAAVDSAGNVVVAGTFTGPTDFVPTPSGASGQDVFVAKLAAATGSVMWAVSFGGTGNDAAYGVTVDAANDVVVTGAFQTSVQFGATNLISQGALDIFLAKLDGASGAVRWAKSFGTTNPGRDDVGWGVTSDSTNAIFLAATCGASCNVGGSGLASSGGGNTSVLAKFAGIDGAHIWSRTPTAVAGNEARQVTVDPNGNVIFAGRVGSGSYDFGGGSRSTTDSLAMYVAKYSSGNNHLWSRVLGSTTPQYGTTGRGVATTTNGDIVVAGDLSTTLDVGCGAMTKYSGFFDGFVARLRTTDGACVWSENWPNAYTDQPVAGVATDSVDDILLGGTFQGTVNFGGGNLTVNGSPNFDTDAYLARLTSSGGYRWARSFGDPNSQGASRVVVDANRNVTLVGYYQGSVNFGGGTLPSMGSNDIYAASYGHL